MNIQIRLFAGLAAGIGSSMVQIQTMGSESVSILWIQEELCSRYPNLTQQIKSAMIAVNQEYAIKDTLVDETDEIAFIPPVSGG